MNATKNLGGEPRMVSNLESCPFSAVMRENRKVPTIRRHNKLGYHLDKYFDDLHLAAHRDTAKLKTTCRQFSKPAPVLDILANKLGHAGFVAPTAAAAARARMAGM